MTGLFMLKVRACLSDPSPFGRATENVSGDLNLAGVSEFRPPRLATCPLPSSDPGASGSRPSLEERGIRYLRSLLGGLSEHPGDAPGHFHVEEWPTIWRQGLVSGLDTNQAVEIEGGKKTNQVFKLRLSDRIRRIELIGKHVCHAGRNLGAWAPR